MRPALSTLLSLALATLLPAPVAIAQSPQSSPRFMLLPTTSLQLHAQNGQTVSAHVELATTPDSQALGLMYRQHLPANQGMLFVYDNNNAAGCFWMRNTLVPLSIAFIDAQGIIQQVNHMQPLSDALHCPKAGLAARYALEMNAGWFSRNGLKIGDRISGLPNLPQ